MIHEDTISRLVARLPEDAKYPGNCKSWREAITIDYYHNRVVYYLWFNKDNNTTSLIKEECDVFHN